MPSPRDIIRKGEAVYKQFELEDPALTDDALIAAMVGHPILIERPIVVVGDKAVIGRPPSAVLDILGIKPDSYDGKVARTSAG